MAQTEMPVADHPLDPLTEEEIEQTTEILTEQRDLGDEFGFYSYQPVEPAKDEIEDRSESGRVDREVFEIGRAHV